MDARKFYSYCRAEQIKQDTIDCPSGTPIRSRSDLINWIDRMHHHSKEKLGQRKNASNNLIVATFVIDRHEDLLLADRHSEHVACAGGAAILAAGEIFISGDRECLEISDLTNQSTGYCPEPESWEYVKIALDKIPIDRPNSFTTEFIFRRCDDCLQINIIKDNIFLCSVCNSSLSDKWNLK